MGRSPEAHICSICQKEFTEFGSTAEPINNGRCCNRCNDEVVIPARIRRMRRERQIRLQERRGGDARARI